MKRLLGLLVIVGIIGAIAAASFHFGSSQMKKAEASELNPLHQIQEGDVVLGDENAPIAIIEYSSLSCPHCASFHANILPKLKENYISKGIARYTNRPFPLNEPALRAAMLVDCVGPERAMKFSSVLFELQDKWAFSGDFLDNLKKIAAVGGVSAEQFSACMTDTDVEEKIIKVRQEASEKLSVQGTPTFFLNGVEISGKMTIESFDTVIQSIIDEQ